MTLKTHELKIWPVFFAAVRNGTKPFEVRRDDRKFEPGDRLVLQEFEPCETCGGSGMHDFRRDCSAPHGHYTGQELEAKITFKLPGGHWGIEHGYCVLGLGEIVERFTLTKR